MLQVPLKYKYASIIVLPILLFFISGCGVEINTPAPQPSNVMDISYIPQMYYQDVIESNKSLALDFFLTYSGIRFSEIDSRSFEVFYPAKINYENFYIIIVSGNLNNGYTYPIDTFAVNIDNSRFYIYSYKTGEFVYYSKPIFYRSVTSENNRYRIGFFNAGRSQLSRHNSIFMGDLYLNDLYTGELLWISHQLQSVRISSIAWSKGDRFVAYEIQGIWNSDTIIVDTIERRYVSFIGLNFVLDEISKKAHSEINSSYGSELFFTIGKWICDSVLQINFSLLTIDGFMLNGSCYFDLANMYLKEIVFCEKY